MLGKAVPMLATITEPTNRYRKCQHTVNKHTIYLSCILHICMCVSIRQIQVGVEFEASTRTQETTTSFGYQMELPEANMVFRGKQLFFSADLMFDENYQERIREIFSVCVPRYDKQSVHNRRCVGEASDPAPCNPDYGRVRKSPR